MHDSLTDTSPTFCLERVGAEIPCSPHFSLSTNIPPGPNMCVLMEIEGGLFLLFPLSPPRVIRANFIFNSCLSSSSRIIQALMVSKHRVLSNGGMSKQELGVCNQSYFKNRFDFCLVTGWKCWHRQHESSCLFNIAEQIRGNVLIDSIFRDIQSMGS